MLFRSGGLVAALRGPDGGLVTGLVARLEDELRVLSRFNDPRGIYAHCFCTVDAVP